MSENSRSPAEAVISTWSDEKLCVCLDAARSGNSEALGEIFGQLRDYLLVAAERQLDDRLRIKVAASDLVQQSLLEATNGFARFRGRTEAEVRVWLAKILRHNLADAAKEFHGSQRRSLEREQNLSGLSEQRSRGQLTASSICRRQEQDEALEDAIQKLPERYREAIMLRHRDEMSWCQVGERLGITSEAARKLWTRALVRLRGELGEEYESSTRRSTR